MGRRNNGPKWQEKVPAITKMAATMNDKQIAEFYGVEPRVIRNVRRYYKINCTGVTALPHERTPRQLVKSLTWDFSWQNL